MGKQQTRTSRYEIPIDEINDLQKSYERVNIKVSRRNHKGHLATVWTGEKATTELTQIDQWLQIFSGGGDYTVEVRNPTSMTRLIEPFVAVVEGQPRPPMFAGSLPEQQLPAGAPPALTVGPPPAFMPGAQPPEGGQPPMSSPPYQPPLPPWAMGLSPWDQGGYAAYRDRRYPTSAPGATVPSDQLALKQVADLKAENAKLAEKLEGALSRFGEETARLRDDNATLRAELLAKKSEGELAALKAELMALREKPAAGPKIDWNGVAMIASAVAPVIGTMIQSNSERSVSALRAQQEGMQQLMTATLSQANKDSGTKELLTTLLPLAMPLLQGMLQQKDPEKQAALYEALANSQLNTVAMMAQLVEATAASQGPEPPWWLPAVQNVLQDGLKVFQQYVATPGGLPGQKPQQPPQPRALPPQKAQPAPAPQQAQAPRITDDLDVQRHVPESVEQMLPHLPAEFQTDAWLGFLRAIHATPQYTPEYLGDGLVEILAMYVDENAPFPSPLANVLEQPEEVFTEMLRYLPITQQDPEYVRALVVRATQRVHEEFGEDEVAKPSAVEEIQAATPREVEAAAS